MGRGTHPLPPPESGSPPPLSSPTCPPASPVRAGRSTQVTEMPPGISFIKEFTGVTVSVSFSPLSDLKGHRAEQGLQMCASGHKIKT